ncbi:histidine kinase [Sphingosinicella rhizophila]|uniref:Histidine kinase n=1 Tax=Sphingosinicella rhizophila TaxID=3050082 RepID=A0ABU3Q7Y5_9SPHN|nr:histidine kinase [Sphingosinicella sp. GR2756]MDT9599194.1 histidine kinase [Sphingosinicella sp. GR2756]
MAAEGLTFAPSAELSVKAQEAQVLALRYQINPHFLFNTLNAISALVRDAPAKAEEMLVQLSDFFRRTLTVDLAEDVTLPEVACSQRVNENGLASAQDA